MNFIINEMHINLKWEFGVLDKCFIGLVSLEFVKYDDTFILIVVGAPYNFERMLIICCLA